MYMSTEFINSLRINIELDKGNLDHEELFVSKEKMDMRYKELFNWRDLALNPTAWELKNGNWERLLGY